jgi:hypothetical protein
MLNTSCACVRHGAGQRIQKVLDDMLEPLTDEFAINPLVCACGRRLPPRV